MGLKTDTSSELLLEPLDGSSPNCIRAPSPELTARKSVKESNGEKNTAVLQANVALLAAAEHGNESQIEKLLQGEADVDAQDDGGATAMHKAAQNGNIKCLSLLISAKGAVNAEDKLGRTPTWRAACYGELNAVKLLFEAGADLQKEDKNEITPVFMAAANDHEDVKEFLDHHWMDLNRRRKYLLENGRSNEALALMERSM